MTFREAFLYLHLKYSYNEKDGAKNRDWYIKNHISLDKPDNRNTTLQRLTSSVKKLSSLQCIMLAAPLALTQIAYANVEISFRESAPKDSFTLKNLSTCDLQDVFLEIDLSTSAGRLIFDTTANGAGVEVFQPFEVKQGNMTLTSASTVQDGDTALSVQIDQIKASETVSFTIDVDDTLAKSELGNIRVSGAEIEGGAVQLSVQNADQFSATFGNTATAIIDLQTTCPTTAN